MLAAGGACSASIVTLLIEELGDSATEFITLDSAEEFITSGDSAGEMTLLLGVYDDGEVCAEVYEPGESSVGSEVLILT